MIQEKKPAVVVLDVFMRNVDAEGVLARVQSEDFSPRPVFLASSTVDQPAASGADAQQWSGVLLQ